MNVPEYVTLLSLQLAALPGASPPNNNRFSERHLSAFAPADPRLINLGWLTRGTVDMPGLLNLGIRPPVR